MAKQRKVEGEPLDVLRQLLEEGRNDEIVKLVEELLARNAELELKLATRFRRNPGEGVSSNQLLLLFGGLGKQPPPPDADPADLRPQVSAELEKLVDFPDFERRKAEEAEAKKNNKKKGRKAPTREPLPSNLDRVQNLITVPEGERACPSCREERTCIGHDVTEVVELIPARVVVRVDMREKLACKACEAEVVIAPAGDKVVSGGRCGPMLVATMLNDKYCFGLPWHRQLERFEAMGYPMPLSTATDQAKWAAERFDPLWRLALDQCMTSEIMHVDGTSMPVLDKNKTGGLRIGSMWGYVGYNPSHEAPGQIACIIYTSTGMKNKQAKGELGPEDVLLERAAALASFPEDSVARQGYTVADASNIFEASFALPGLTECGCNMHARRYFKKALDAGDERAVLPLGAFKRLHLIEKDIRDLPIDKKQAQRDALSLPVYEGLLKWCEEHQRYEPPSSPMGRANGYLPNHKEALMRFISDGVIPIDNGLVERFHVRTALTRKNFLFVGSDDGGRRAAIIYTILGCCRLAGVDAVEYMADVLPRLGGKLRREDLLELMPAQWKAARERAAAAA